MYQDSKRTCAAIILLIKSFVLCRSRFRRRLGFLKRPNEAREDATCAYLSGQNIPCARHPLMKNDR